MSHIENHGFGPIDWERVRLLGKLPRERRVLLMLNTSRAAKTFIRSRLRRQYPDLSNQELNMKLIEEIDRVGRRKTPRF